MSPSLPHVLHWFRTSWFPESLSRMDAECVLLRTEKIGIPNFAALHAVSDKNSAWNGRKLVNFKIRSGLCHPYSRLWYPFPRHLFPNNSIYQQFYSEQGPFVLISLSSGLFWTFGEIKAKFRFFSFFDLKGMKKLMSDHEADIHCLYLAGNEPIEKCSGKFD